MTNVTVIMNVIAKIMNKNEKNIIDVIFKELQEIDEFEANFRPTLQSIKRKEYLLNLLKTLNYEQI